ncbi:hypothetical protein ES703_108075 [subsurface metagenome]
MKSERYLEWICAGVTDTLGVPAGYSVYNEIMIPLPTSGTEIMALLLHEVDFIVAGAEFGVDTQMSSNGVYLTKSHHTAPVNNNLADPDLIAMFMEHATINQVAGAGQLLWWDGIPVWRFSPPILIARDAVYFANRTFSQAAANTVASVRLGYTLEKVSREAFIAALVG